jgi:hydroxylamine reductase (hybrid-cluster protein)
MEMPMCNADIPDPYEGLSESDALFVMNLVEQLGYDINDVIAIAMPSWYDQRMVSTALAQLMA